MATTAARRPAGAGHLARGRSARAGGGGHGGLLAARGAALVADGPRQAHDGVVRGDDRVLLHVLRGVHRARLRHGQRAHRDRADDRRLHAGQHRDHPRRRLQRPHRGAVLAQHVRLRRRRDRDADLRRHRDLLPRVRGLGDRGRGADLLRRPDQALVRGRDRDHRAAGVARRAHVAGPPQRRAAAVLRRRAARRADLGALQRGLPRLPARRQGRAGHDAAVAAGVQRLHGRLDPDDVHVRLRPPRAARRRALPPRRSRSAGCTTR